MAPRHLSMTPVAIRSRRARKRKGSRLAQARGLRVRIRHVPLADHISERFKELAGVDSDQEVDEEIGRLVTEYVESQ